jgi:hypothetical protein
MAADMFGERIKRQISAVPQRRLKHGEERVIATDDRSRALAACDVLRNSSHERNIDEAVRSS